MLNVKGSLIRKQGEDSFVLNHLHSSSPVCYSALGWRQISTNMARTNLAAELLRKSGKYESFREEKGEDNCDNIISLELRSLASDVLSPQNFGGSRCVSLDELKAKMSCLQVGRADWTDEI